jgi:hypothetical protein
LIDERERALLEEGLRAFLARSSGQGWEAVDTALGEFGWLGLLEGETDEALAIVFSELGAADAASTVLDDVLLLALGLSPGDGGAVLLPPVACSQASVDLLDGELRGCGLLTARVLGAPEVVVAAREGEGQIVLCRIASEDVECGSVTEMDPRSGFRLARLEGVRSRGTIGGGKQEWRRAVAFGQRAISSQIAGACRMMLELARGHALTREQFGRPIARFQAVRHRLAEALVGLEGLEAALVAARDGDPRSATLAKAIAARTSTTVMAHCQQVLGGIGFTTDHSFHRYLKRTLLLQGLFGSGAELNAEIGRELLSSRQVPRLIEL